MSEGQGRVGKSANFCTAYIPVIGPFARGYEYRLDLTSLAKNDKFRGVALALEPKLLGLGLGNGRSTNLNRQRLRAARPLAIEMAVLKPSPLGREGDPAGGAASGSKT